MAFTLRWGTGFEGGFASAGGSYTVTTGGYHGTYRAIMQPYSYGTNSVYLQKVSGVGNDVYISVWCMCREGADGRIYLTLTDGNHLSVRWQNSDSRWHAYVNETLVQTGQIGISGFAVHHLQIHFKVADSQGLIETRVNGTPDLSYSGDTKPGSVDTPSSIYWYDPGPWENYVDDFCFGTGDWPGDVRFEKIVPNADASRAWFSNGQSSQTSPGAASVATGAAGSLTGDYYYKVTFVDAEGETLAGSTSSLVQPSSQKVNLSSIPTGISGTTSRKIYRTAAGGATFKLVDTIPDNTTTTYEDNVTDGNLGANEPAFTSYDKLDEVPPSDSDYIYTHTNGLQDIHEASSWSSGGNKIPIGIVQFIRAWRSSSANNNVKILTKLSGTTDTGPEESLSTTAYYYSKTMATKPGGGDWTEADINAVQVGVESVIP